VNNVNTVKVPDPEVKITGEVSEGVSVKLGPLGSNSRLIPKEGGEVLVGGSCLELNGEHRWIHGRNKDNSEFRYCSRCEEGIETINREKAEVSDWNPREEFESRRKIMALYKDSPIMGMADYERLLTAYEEQKFKLESHAPEGHNVTNQQYVELRQLAEDRGKEIEELRKKAKCWDEAKEPGEFGGFIDLDREMVEELEKKHGVK
jgi:hypothetical protein